MKNLQSKNARSTRVLIAQDVLEQLIAEQLLPTTMAYLTWENWFSFKKEDEIGATLKAARPCNVCAKGAAFVAMSKRFSDRKMGSILSGNHINSDRLHEQLHEYFDEDNLNQIEAAFECWSPKEQFFEQYSQFDYIEDFEDEMKPHNYDISSPPTPSVRMAYIMLNIIRHDGDFNPEAWLQTAEKGFDSTIISKLAEQNSQKKDKVGV